MTFVAKRSPISATAEHLSICVCKVVNSTTFVICIEATTRAVCGVYTTEQQQVGDVVPRQLQEEMRGQTTVVSDNVSQLDQQIKDRECKINSLSLLNFALATCRDAAKA